MLQKQIEEGFLKMKEKYLKANSSWTNLYEGKK
jgi:hypothetical protein